MGQCKTCIIGSACTYMDDHVHVFSSIFMNSPHISPSFLISVRGKETMYGMRAYL